MSTLRTIVAPPRIVSARTAARALASLIASIVLLVLAVRGAVSALFPTWVAALLLPALAIAAVVAFFFTGVTLGPMATDETGEPRPLLRRHGFYLVLLSIVIGLPLLGAYSLVDPWETHYAEVAREMLERRDFLSPWWANEGWFMSKPVLLFWLEAPSMWLLGVHAGPDQVLVNGSSLLHPEYAVRMPGFVLSILGAYILYNGVSRTVSRRAGLLGGMALVTSAGYALLSHQAITDMPLLASIAAACGLLLRALATSDEARSRGFALSIGAKTVTLHAGQLTAAVFLAFTLPQLAMLLATHVHQGAHGVFLGLDQLRAGSPNSCTLPGQPACADVALAHKQLQPIVQVCIWMPLMAWVTYGVSKERRLSRLFALLAWIAAAFGTMDKGPAALVVPAAGAVTALLSRRSVRPFFRLELLRGAAITVAMVAPWYLAVYARHGRVFVDELVFRHMLGRTLEHLHDTNGTDDVGLVYFVKQLGYATFPWSGIAAVAMVSAARADASDRPASRHAHVRALLFGAGIASYALVSTMGTKFHHYGLIALPTIAMVSGVWLDERIAEAASKRGAHRRWSSAALFTAAGFVTCLVARDFAMPSGPARFFHLLTYRYDRHWVSTASWTTFLAIAGSALGALVLVTIVRRRFGAYAFTSASALFAVWLTSLYLVTGAHDGGQRGIFEAYYRARAADPTRSPVIAYQLNWKGENFYSGNDVAIFVASGAPMRTYLESREKLNEHAFYFVTERGRVNGLRAELGNVQSFHELADRSVSDEYALVRVEM